MPATIVAAIAAPEQKAGREDAETIFKVVIFVFDERKLLAVFGSAVG
jgi:hypothetical protein